MFRLTTLMIAAVLPLAALAAEGSDLIFADRAPWVLPDGGLDWAVTRQSPTGDTAATLQLDPGAEASTLVMSEQTAAGTRPLSQFPVSAGDPVVVYFLEAVTRDMASASGGSPFYIRNRIKDALRAGGTVTHDGAGARVTLMPFADNENAARMAGFDTLTLRFDIAADPHQPMPHLHAETAKPVGDKPYVLDLTLKAAP